MPLGSHGIGEIVSTVAPPSQDEAKKFGVRAQMINLTPNHSELTKIAALTADGKLELRIGKVLPLADAKKAQETGEAGETDGKIVLRVNN